MWRSQQVQCLFLLERQYGLSVFAGHMACHSGEIGQNPKQQEANLPDIRTHKQWNGTVSLELCSHL